MSSILECFLCVLEPFSSIGFSVSLTGFPFYYISSLTGFSKSLMGYSQHRVLGEICVFFGAIFVNGFFEIVKGLLATPGFG